jgi:hypothetical protein
MDNEASENGSDTDLGSGGTIVLPDLTDNSGVVWHLAVGAGKDTNLYLVNRDSMGKYSPSNNNIYQEIPGALPGGIWSMPAYFNGEIYYGSVSTPIYAFQFSDALLTGPVSQTTTTFEYPGTTPSISANGNANGIVWAAENANPAILHAYNATNLQELYNTNQAPHGRDHFGTGNKFITPTIANGKVYVGTTTGVGVFGLFMPPGIYSPVNNSTLTGTAATFQWYGDTGATAYWLNVGKEQGGNEYYQSGSLPTSTLSQTVSSLPADGSTVWARWYYMLSGTWQHIDYTYTAFGGAADRGVITSPTPSSTLTGSSVTFTWTAGSGATAYWLDIGNVAGGDQYLQSGNLGNVLTTKVNGLPTNGSTVYVSLYSLVSGTWLSNAYTYTAYNLAAAGGVLTTPTPGSTLTGSRVTFDWTAGAGASAYWLDVGSRLGGNQYYQSGNLGNVLTTTANGLPTNGSTIYVTLYSLIGGVWSGSAYTYTAFNAATGLAVMQTPTPGSTLSGNAATFTWSAGAGPTAYWLDIGSAPGGNTYFQSGNLGTALTTTVYSLPANGSTIYVTLYSLVGGQWLSNAYTYVSGP